MSTPTITAIIASDRVMLEAAPAAPAAHAVPLALDVRSAVIEALLEAIPGLDPRDATLAVDLAQRVPVDIAAPRT